MPYITEITANQAVERVSDRGASNTTFSSICVKESLQRPSTFVSAVVTEEELQKMTQAMTELHVSSEDPSRTPSPINSRGSSPRRSTMPCPIRLTSLIPPVNYGSVHRNAIYRSGFPQAKNIDFLEGLHIRSILTLVDTECGDEYSAYIKQYGVQHKVVSILANKEGKISTTTESICEALAFILSPVNQPVYVHCNQGRHRTGCVIACLRRVQQWPLEEVLAEYNAYASPKARPADMEFITSFKPESLVAYGKAHDVFRWSRRVPECANDVYDLAAAVLSAYDMMQDNSPHDSLLDLQGVGKQIRIQANDRPPPLVNANSPNDYGVTVIDYALTASAPAVAKSLDEETFVGVSVIKEIPGGSEAGVVAGDRNDRTSRQTTPISLGGPSSPPHQRPVSSVGA